MKRTCFCLTIVCLVILIAVFGSSCKKTDNANETPSPDLSNNLIDDDKVEYVKEAILDPSIMTIEQTDSPATEVDPLDALLNDLYRTETNSSSPADNAVISEIIELAKIEKAEVLENGTTANVVVIAPDMSKILNALLDNEYAEPISAANLEAYILNALKDESNFKEFTATVSTIEVDGKLILDPSDEELRNAMTGGFRDAFTEFYYKSLEAIFDAMSKNN